MTDDANVRDQRPDETPLQPERAVRLLRAKAAELEDDVRTGAAPRTNADRDITYLMADIALVATLLADHIERVEFGFEAVAAKFLNEDGTPWGPDHPDYDEMGQ